MNKQRKVLITITYNEMGIIIDTKAEEVAQPTCNNLATDTISRQAAIDDLHGRDPSQLWDAADIEVWIKALPSAQMDSTCVGCRYERKGSVVCDDCSRFFMDRYER